MSAPHPPRFNVLIYSGPGTAASSLAQTTRTLRAVLMPYYTVQLVTPQELLSDPWTTKCALLVMPGGRDTPYHSALSGRGNELIRDFVETGGAYLGICAGGYYGAREIRFMLEDPQMRVQTKRELAFWDGPCEGTVFPGFEYGGEDGARGCKLVLENGGSELEEAIRCSPSKVQPKPLAIEGSAVSHIYYNGGGCFVPPKNPSAAFKRDTRVLARYADRPDQPAAAVWIKVNKGRAVLIGSHPEYSLFDEPLQSALEKDVSSTKPALTEKERAHAESQRLEFMRGLLLALGLGIPDDTSVNLHKPTRPLPQFLVAHPSQPDLPSKLLDNLSRHLTAPAASADPGPSILVDSNDTFHVHKSTDLPSVDAFLAQMRSSDITVEEEDDLNKVIKDIVVVPADGKQERSWTPLFDWEKYWSVLDKSRSEKQGAAGREGRKNRLGDLVFYSEAVTSTQTLLERNHTLFASVPLPISSFASYQLAARGRSGNAWLSPQGMAVVSFALELTTAQAPKVVFVQYLAALAIAIALDPTGKLGVKIKWPNDVYAVVGEGKTAEKLKIGGILVSSVFTDGKFKVMPGCGVSILNPHPTTSLFSLIKAYNEKLGEGDEPLPVPTIEESLAKILATFEAYWDVFVSAEGSGFEPFLSEYLDRWLHSGEIVRLTSHVPPLSVIISTITLDHGLLRTIPIRGSDSSYGSSEYDRYRKPANNWNEPEFIDLQPDGNSFDIMKGMIRKK